MKVIINASNIKVGGGVQVALSFVHSLFKFEGFNFYLLSSSKIYEQLDFDRIPDSVEVFKVDFGLKHWLKGSAKDLNEIEARIDPDIVFTIFGPSYWTPKSKHLMGFALPWLINPHSKAFGEVSTVMWVKKRVQNAIKAFFIKKNSQFFVVETEDVRRRLLKYLDIPLSKTWVVSNTYNQNFIGFRVKKPKRGMWFKFITIAANYPHKNLKILRRVIPILRARGLKARFTLTIPEKDFRSTFGKESDYLRNVGPLKSFECPSQYSDADALFLPTLLECFTASYPEAMIMGRPILTSDLSFAKQICGEECALFFDPLDPYEIADRIQEIIKDEALYNKLVKNGNERVKNFLTYDQRAKSYLKIIEEIIKD